MSSAIVSKSSKLYSKDNITYNLLKNSNCWIDFSDSSTYTLTGTGSNYTLATVTDKSNDARTVTVTGACPFDDALKCMINLAGTGNYLSVGTGGATTATSTETVFLVASQANNTANTPSFFGTLTTGARYARFGTGFTYGRVGSSLIGGINALPAGELIVLSVVCNNTNIKTFYNGKYDSAPNATTAFTANATTTRIGQTNTSNYQIGNLFEIIFFNDALADDQRQMIEYYLMKKWKITSTISSPTSISGCTLWLDGKDASTITYSSGTSIQQWNDKSGNNYHAIQNTVANQPTYDSVTPGVNFVTTSLQFMVSNAPYSATETVYAVLKHNNVANVTFLGTTDTAGGRQLRTNAGSIRLYNAATLAVSGYRTNIPASTLFLFEYMNAASRSILNINKAVDSVGGRASMPGGTFTQKIGQRGTSGSNYDGVIAELIVFNRELTGSERSSISNYLFTKWNITVGPNLFSPDQPYASIPPYLRFSRPTDVLGCQLWLDAADSTSVTLSGSNVTTWLDKSGNANNAVQATTANQPTYSSNGVVFNGTSSYLTTVYSASLSNETIFIVATLTGSTSTGIAHTLVASSANGGRHLFTYGSALNVNSQNVQAGPSGGTVTANQKILFEYIRATGNAITLLLNANSAATGTLNAFTAALTTWIGRWPGSTTDNWQGPIYEIICYNRTLSKNEQQLIEGYLAQKWGLKSYLPSVHAFKSELALTPGFDPRKFSPILWLDATDPNGNGTLPSVDSGLNTWVDKSGNGKSATNASSTTRPVFTYDGKYPAVQFSKADSQFIRGVSLLTSTSFSIFVAARSTSTGIGRDTTFFDRKVNTTGAENYISFYIYHAPNSLPASRRMNIYYTTAATPRYKYIDYTPSIDINAPTLMTICEEAVSTTLPFFENGSAIDGAQISGSSSSVSTDADGYTLGRTTIAGSTSNYLNGYIYEVIVILSLLNTSQRQQIEGYLAWKWGTQSYLPSTHPFAKYPPN